jgi:hypothetical protein
MDKHEFHSIKLSEYSIGLPRDSGRTFILNKTVQNTLDLRGYFFHKRPS